MRREEVSAFFNTYLEAFNRLDGDAVAELWHVPCGIAQADGLTWWAEDAPMRANHQALCQVYRHAGYGHAEFEIDTCQALGPHQAFACLHWRLWRSDGTLLQRFHTAYNLLRTPRGVRVLLCTAFEENLARMTPHAAQ